MPNAIIIGASSGIGLELTRLLASKGYNVGIAARRGHLLKKVSKEFPANIIPIPMNICYRESALKKLQFFIRSFGAIDLFVLSSAVGFRNDTLEWKLEKETVEVNVSAYTSLMEYMYRFFSKQGYGHIVGISSIAGLRGNRWAPAYAASKAYQINLLESLRVKAKKERKNIIVSDIRPGFVDTRMAQGDDLFWVASPEKAAKQILQAIHSKKKVAYITKRWVLVAWVMKVLPRWLLEKI